MFQSIIMLRHRTLRRGLACWLAGWLGRLVWPHSFGELGGGRVWRSWRARWQAWWALGARGKVEFASQTDSGREGGEHALAVALALALQCGSGGLRAQWRTLRSGSVRAASSAGHVLPQRSTVVVPLVCKPHERSPVRSCVSLAAQGRPEITCSINQPRAEWPPPPPVTVCGL